MALKDPAFPASAVFDTINDALKADPKEQQNALKTKTIFAFTIKNKEGKQESWHIDLKNKGVAGKGLAPEGQKPNVTLLLADEDFQKLASGSGNAQNMFMSGKLKIKGNIMAAQKLTPVLQRAQSKAKL